MMRNGALTIATFVSVLLLPWPFTVLLAVVTAFFEPLVPFAAGIFADTLYFTAGTGTVPMYAFYGLIVSIAAILVRRRLSASIIR